MAPTKITLSPAEHQLVLNADWILTKNAVIGKLGVLFGQLSESYDALLEQYGVAAEDTGTRSPKISKGEQYEGLPWVMLDHPRNFSGQDSFAIRSFFWWGHFCSITLLLSGCYREKYVEGLEERLRTEPDDWLISTAADPWQHHLRVDSHTGYESLNGTLGELSFIKLSKRVSLENWDALPAFFCNGYAAILELLGYRRDTTQHALPQ